MKVKLMKSGSIAFLVVMSAILTLIVRMDGFSEANPALAIVTVAAFVGLIVIGYGALKNTIEFYEDVMMDDEKVVVNNCDNCGAEIYANEPYGNEDFNGTVICSKCLGHIGYVKEVLDKHSIDPDYCPACGQRLDWG